MRVLYVQYTNPGAYPPLVRGARLLAQSGAAVTMLGTRVRGLDALDAPPAPGVTVRLTAMAADGWRLKAHYARYAAWVAREGVNLEPDWIYASDLLSAPIALAVAALTGARLVYHEHDAPSLAHESWTIRRCLEARQRLLRQADIVITPNAERSAHLTVLAGGRSVVTVWNCPHRPSDLPTRATESSALRVIFRGSINADRLPATVIQALARVGGETHLDIAGYETVGSRGHVAALLALAERLGVRERVRMLGTVPDATLATICAECDVGLALMPVASLDENMRHMTGASNKVFEYLSDGVTPLVSELPDWRATFVDPGYALACDPRDRDSIASAFAWVAEHRHEARSIAVRGWERLRADWNYESQFEPVLRAMFALRSVATYGAAETSDAHGEARCAS
jgi:glycosyltransferase involved in cell wall biosynthesis